jgi:hypothetical protein
MMLLQLLKNLLLLINMVLLLLPIWLAKVTKNEFIFAKDGVIAAVQDGATKQELFLLRMVLLLLLEMTGNGATAAAKNGIALARDGAVAAAKDDWQWCYCSC